MKVNVRVMRSKKQIVYIENSEVEYDIILTDFFLLPSDIQRRAEILDFPTPTKKNFNLAPTFKQITFNVLLNLKTSLTFFRGKMRQLR